MRDEGAYAPANGRDVVNRGELMGVRLLGTGGDGARAAMRARRYGRAYRY